MGGGGERERRDWVYSFWGVCFFEKEVTESID